MAFTASEAPVSHAVWLLLKVDLRLFAVMELDIESEVSYVLLHTPKVPCIALKLDIDEVARHNLSQRPLWLLRCCIL